MKPLRPLVMAMALAGCTSHGVVTPPKYISPNISSFAEFQAEARAKAKAANRLSNEPGMRALQIRQACAATADVACPRNSLACRAYRQTYVPNCMVAEGVSPEYVMVLTR